MQKSIQYITASLSFLYSKDELDVIVRTLIAEVTDFTYSQIIINKSTIFSDEQEKKIYSFVEKLKKGEPLQYVVGHVEFYGLKIGLAEGVLIPRPETEELLEWIGETLNKKTAYRMLDVGTGSGCIPLVLKYLFPASDVTGMDISARALSVAQKNAQKLNLHVSFEQKDIFKYHAGPESFDLIVSNPPYIPWLEKTTMQKSVIDFEPEMALFVPDDDPLIFYRQIAIVAQKALVGGGWLFFEIHRDFGRACAQLLHEVGYENVEIRKDISGNDRMIKAQKTSIAGK